MRQRRTSEEGDLGVLASTREVQLPEFGHDFHGSNIGFLVVLSNRSPDLELFQVGKRLDKKQMRARAQKNKAKRG